MVQKIANNLYYRCVSYCILIVGFIIMWYSIVLSGEDFKAPAPFRRPKPFYPNEDTQEIDKTKETNGEYISRMIFGRRPRLRRGKKNNDEINARTTLLNPTSIPATVSVETNIIYDEDAKSTTLLTNSAKNILVWNPECPPFTEVNLTAAYMHNECEYSNCYFTSERRHLDDTRQFDAILFSAQPIEMSEIIKFKGPEKRSSRQKFIFVATESAVTYPINNPIFDDYFNWTWTYRLDSDILWRKFLIIDHEKQVVVGPRADMEWATAPTTSIDNYLRDILKYKSLAAVTILRYCHSLSRREMYIKGLRHALKKYDLQINLFGNCSGFCGTMQSCMRRVSYRYYFYLVFEDSFDQDYVTEHILNAFDYYMIPVVLGGADYSRFLPPNSYLDALKLSPTEMAKTMFNIITNFTLHLEYFSWTNKYTFKPASTEVCNLCKAMNDEELVAKQTSYKNFRKWWNPDKKVAEDFVARTVEDNKLIFNKHGNETLSLTHFEGLKKFLKNKFMNDDSQDNSIIDI